MDKSPALSSPSPRSIWKDDYSAKPDRATDAIATTFVANQPADGTVSSSARRIRISISNRSLQIDYDQFDPVFLMMANVGVVLVGKDSPYTT